MGAFPFSQYADGADPVAAFAEATQQARYEHGHGGYSGTIAEKDDYIVITATPLEPEQAQTLADDLITRCDPRIDDKWGPAGAIAVRQPTRTVTVGNLHGTTTDTWNLDEQALTLITQAARERGLISADETVETGRLITYQQATRPHSWTIQHSAPPVTYHDGTAQLTVRKNPAALAAQSRPDGWLFFGWASS